MTTPTDPVREAMARKLLAMPDDPAADLPIGALRDEHREAVRVLELHVRSLDAMSQPLGQAVTQYTADENKAQAAAIRKTIDYLAALSHPPAAAEPVAVLYVSAEETPGEGLVVSAGPTQPAFAFPVGKYPLYAAPSTQPTQQAPPAVQAWIPVSERLPEPSGDVLTVDRSGQIRVSWAGLLPTLSTHWMPLPPAPDALTQGQQEKKE